MKGGEEQTNRTAREELVPHTREWGSIGGSQRGEHARRESYA